MAVNFVFWVFLLMICTDYGFACKPSCFKHDCRYRIWRGYMYIRHIYFGPASSTISSNGIINLMYFDCILLLAFSINSLCLAHGLECSKQSRHIYNFSITNSDRANVKSQTHFWGYLSQYVWSHTRQIESKGEWLWIQITLRPRWAVSSHRNTSGRLMNWSLCYIRGWAEKFIGRLWCNGQIWSNVVWFST